ncbi:uncharacterized protein LOC116195603 [Punica granatum]|uniref:PAR1 protein n=2 Tax=Punica granatum TaxID=22663 RepID=A0A218WRY5_PUNGR|nr:uncharacterized protein LOC116195603 [Punica granatum]OWM75614.1 hypothetical protein CDL15_Pgr021779 [Punica granatum]PKI52061.1 hypothetical protein CRG98_027477 [Punica granatum]
MASRFSSSILAVLALTLALCTQGILGEIACEDLDQDKCAFAVSATSKRCVLEKQVRRSGEEVYTCRASEIKADAYLRDYVETDHCVSACGVDRKSLGISSDSLLEAHFTQKLCSTPCYEYCPNIVDLYFSLAAGEGVFLPKLCEAQKGDVRRGMSEIRSSGMVAPGPIKPVKFTAAPAVSPSYY